MDCDEVWRLISDADGRPVRSPRVRAHLRRCGACGAFARAIPERRGQLRALAPALSPLAAGGVLARALGAGAAHSSDGAGLASAGAGKAVGTAILAKVSAVGLAATAAVGVTVALGHHGSAAHPSSPVTRSAKPAGPLPGSHAGAGGPSFPALPGLASMSDLLGAPHHSVTPINRAHQHRTAAGHGRALRGTPRSAAPFASRHRAAPRHHIAITGRPSRAASSGARPLRGGSPVTTRDRQGTLENRTGSSAIPGRRGGSTTGTVRPLPRHAFQSPLPSVLP